MFSIFLNENNRFLSSWTLPRLIILQFATKLRAPVVFQCTGVKTVANFSAMGRMEPLCVPVS